MPRKPRHTPMEQSSKNPKERRKRTHLADNEVDLELTQFLSGYVQQSKYYSLLAGLI